MRELKNWYIKEGYRNVTINKMFVFLKTFIKWLKAEGYEIQPGVLEYKTNLIVVPKTVTFLTHKELMHFYNFKFAENEKNLELVRDMFCFMAFTSLRYSDLENLKRANVFDDHIEICTKKTHDKLSIHLIPHAKEIINKYKYENYKNGKMFRVYANQKINELLKEAAKKAGLDKEVVQIYYQGTTRHEEVKKFYEIIGCHDARRTFVCCSLAIKMTPTAVMSCTGHSTYQAMKPYIEVADETQKAELAKWDMAEKQNDIKRERNFEKQQAIYDKICHLRFEGDIYRQNSQFESAITSYNLSLQVDYKSVNKWFKSDCIGENLLANNGLIAIYHKLNDFEKEREYIERAISLASLDSRYKNDISKYKHRLEKLLGTYKEKEIPPESHMNVVYTDLTNYIDVLDKMYHPIVIKDGCVVVDKKEAEIYRKIWGYFDSLLSKGRKADDEFDYKTTADMYEKLVAEGYYFYSFPYDRLITLYFNYKLYEDEVRVITSAINTFTQRNGEFHKGTEYKNVGFHSYDKLLARWEKRLVAAKKRLQAYQKKNKNE